MTKFARFSCVPHRKAVALNFRHSKVLGHYGVAGASWVRASISNTWLAAPPYISLCAVFIGIYEQGLRKKTVDGTVIYAQ